MISMAESIKTDPDGYRLARNRNASLRLNAQHYLWKDVCGFNIHPAILSELGPHTKVADVAAGTGIWMLDVKSAHENYSIDAFDISLKQCPPTQLMPRDCTVRQLDMLGEVPEDLRNAYDFIHVRLVLGALQNDPTALVKNFMSMLKPGGYLQWQEINKGANHATAIRPDLDKSGMDAICRFIAELPFGGWVAHLSEILTEHGFVDSKTEKYQLPPHLAFPFCQTQFGAYEEISLGGMDNSTPESQGPAFRNMIAKAEEELFTGVWIDHELEVTVARKPL